MRKFIVITLFLLFMATLISAGFFIGQQTTQRKSQELIEGLSLQGIANDLLALRYIERGETEEARKLLQAETNGYLSWVIESTPANQTLEQAQQKCSALNTLKQYRNKHHLFTAQEWEPLWRLPGAKEEEEKRQAFLNQLNCGDERLFQIEN